MKKFSFSKLKKWSSYNMSGPHIEQSIKEPVRTEETGFVELFLLEVVVLVHRLHQGAQHVDGGVADAVVTQL